MKGDSTHNSSHSDVTTCEAAKVVTTLVQQLKLKRNTSYDGTQTTCPVALHRRSSSQKAQGNTAKAQATLKDNAATSYHQLCPLGLALAMSNRTDAIILDKHFNVVLGVVLTLT